MINTDSGTLGQTISERMLNDTPLPTRSVLDLAITVGNVTGDVGSSDPQLGSGSPLPGFNLQANAGRPGTMNMLPDGITNTIGGLARATFFSSSDTVHQV